MAERVIKLDPTMLSPDLGWLDNNGFVEVLSIYPYGRDQWVTDSLLTEKLDLSEADIRGRFTLPLSDYRNVDQGEQYDDSGTSFVTITDEMNSATANDASPFPAGAGVDDIVYFGFQEKQKRLSITVGTAGVGAYTLTWEYWNGSAWVSLSGLSDGTGAFKTAGRNEVSYTNPSGWARTTVNSGSSLYFVRAKRDAGAVTTDPDLSQVRGFLTTPENWAIYTGSTTKLYQINPVAWTEHDVSGATYVSDDITGWQFTAAGETVIAVGGHNQLAQIRKGHTGLFGNLITNAEPDPTGGGVTENWPPRPRFVAQWGDRIAIAHIADTGPANRNGNVDPTLVWLSAQYNVQTFGTVDTHLGDRTTFFYAQDEHGPITALTGGAEWGAIFKANACYRVTYTSDFLPDSKNISTNIGCVHPNSIAWRGNQCFFMSNAGPAVMTQNEVQLLGTAAIIRSLFDASWIADTWEVNLDRSILYNLWGEYLPALDTVVWSYRNDADNPDVRFAYHISSNRFSILPSLKLVNPTTEVAHTAQIFATFTSPAPESNAFTGGKDLYFISKDASANTSIWEPGPSGTHAWQKQPKLVIPWFALVDQQGRKITSKIRALLLLYSLNAGVIDSAGPAISITVEGKNLPYTNTVLYTDTLTVDDDWGRFKTSSTKMAVYHRVTITYGNTSIVGVKNLADIFKGIEIELTEGGFLE